jgi:alcohol dehydrogenase
LAGHRKTRAKNDRSLAIEEKREDRGAANVCHENAARGKTGTNRRSIRRINMQTMRANVFHGPNNIRLEEVPRPHASPGEAVIRITLTTICGTDLHILRGEYQVKAGLIIGHEPVGVIEELGEGVSGYKIGDRVLVGAITPCGQCRACLSGQWAQCGHGEGVEAIGGWRFGNTINGAQAEYLLVPNAQANLAKIPTELSDERVVLLADIVSTGFSGAESANICTGDTVVVFAQGPIGLCATAGAKLMGASFIIGVESDPVRIEMSKRMGAHVVLDPKECDVVTDVKKLTLGGADVAIEALGMQETFENCLRCLRPGGTLSSLGVYSGKLQVPYDAFAAGIGDYKIVTTLCPGGKERMRRLMLMVQADRFDPTPLLTHSFRLDQIVEAYDLFGSRRDGVLKVAIRP